MKREIDKKYAGKKGEEEKKMDKGGLADIMSSPKIPIKGSEKF